MKDNTSFEALNALPDGAFMIDEGYQVVFVNDALKPWLKCSNIEAVGHHLSAILPELVSTECLGKFDDVFKFEKPMFFSAPLSYSIQSHDDIHLHRIAASPFMTGGKQHVLVTVMDISAVVEQEVEHVKLLEQQNQKLFSAVDQAAEAFVIMSLEGDIEYVNKAFFKQTGWEWADIVKKPEYWAYQYSIDGDIEEHIKAIVEDGETWQGRRNILRKDGSLFTASVSMAPIFDDEGAVMHAVAVQEDISEQLQFEEQYRQTQKQEALATLIGGIAHDFNNLLSGMLGHLYLANREVQELPKTAERLKKIQIVANDIADIVQQLMTFARKGEVDKRKFPLDSFVKEFVKVIEHIIPENIDMTIDFERDHFPCQGDAEGLQDALLNIVQNAVEAAVDERDSKIKMGLKIFKPRQEDKWLQAYPALAEGEYAQITICDNGTGIKKEHLERVFDPFFTTKHLGSGLGLAVAIGNVKKNLGLISVESSSEGSCFYIWLPLLIDKLTQESAVKVHHESQDTVILLVDDDVLVRETCAEILDILGYQVRTAEDGQVGWEYMQAHGDEVDLIIMDMVMPRMVGSVAAVHIRDIYPTVPIIFATAYDQSISIRATKEFKHSTLISKPFHVDSLQESIHGFIGS